MRVASVHFDRIWMPGGIGAAWFSLNPTATTTRRPPPRYLPASCIIAYVHACAPVSPAAAAMITSRSSMTISAGTRGNACTDAISALSVSGELTYRTSILSSMLRVGGTWGSGVGAYERRWRTASFMFAIRVLTLQNRRPPVHLLLGRRDEEHLQWCHCSSSR